MDDAQDYDYLSLHRASESAPAASPGAERTRLFEQLSDVEELAGAAGVLGAPRPRPSLSEQVSPV